MFITSNPPFFNLNENSDSLQVILGNVKNKIKLDIHPLQQNHFSLKFKFTVFWNLLTEKVLKLWKKIHMMSIKTALILKCDFCQQTSKIWVFK